MTRGRRTIPIAVLAVVAVLAAGAAGRADTPCAPAGDAVAEQVEAVAGGTTLVLAGGQKVRLAGILVPMSGRHDAAATAALRDLLAGKKARLARAGHADRHGRIVADVFTAGATPLMAQEALVAAGLARVVPIKDNPACTTLLLAAEYAARRANIGLWRDAAFAVRAADRPEELNGLIDTFQIVEGEIVSTGATRSRAYLNFGDSWKSDFTGVISAGDLDDFVAAGLIPSQLAGKRVRLRGYLEEDGGPMIRLGLPGQVELAGDR